MPSRSRRPRPPPRPSHSARRPASRSAIKPASASRTRRRPNSTARSIRSASRSASHWRRQRASASSRTVPAIDASRIAKSGSIPASRAWRRSRWPQNSWKVPIGAASSARRIPRHRAMSAPARSRSRLCFRMRWRSSRAAFSVNVIATSALKGLGSGSSRSPRNRAVSTVVLPHPAPALSATLASMTDIGAACCSVNLNPGTGSGPVIVSAPAGARRRGPCRARGPA